MPFSIIVVEKICVSEAGNLDIFHQKIILE